MDAKKLFVYLNVERVSLLQNKVWIFHIIHFEVINHNFGILEF